jgi:lysozyme
MLDKLLYRLKEHEGFDGKPYRDTEGYLTIGYGTKLPITQYEAGLLLKSRLDDTIKTMINHRPDVLNLPEDKQYIIYEMAYQIGVQGVLKFKKMWKALEREDFKEASNQMLDSKWAIQTPNRAGELASMMEE